MKKILSLVFISLFTFNVFADYSVIVNKSNDAELNNDNIGRVFLGRDNSFPNGKSAEAINLADSNNVRQAFDKEVVGRSTSQVNSHWAKVTFTGKGTPPKVMTEQEVLNYVSSNENAIGYVPSNMVNDSVKVVVTFQ